MTSRIANVLSSKVSRLLVSRLGVSISVLIGSVSLLVTPITSAEVYYAYAPHAGVVEIIDTESSAYRLKPVSASAENVEFNNIAWTITYKDEEVGGGGGPLIGFADPDFGAQRKARLEDALEYISSVLNESGSLDLEVRESTSGTGPLACGGTFFEVTSTFQMGAAFEHLTTDVDPSVNIPDLFLTVDFGFNWNEGTGAPSGSQVDLISVLVHEITHGLGIASLSDSSGASLMSPTDLYTSWDELLERGSVTQDLFALVSTTPTFLGAASDLISDDVVFKGSNATAAFGSSPPVYAPTTFTGSSLSHFDGSLTAIMTPSIPPGEMQRIYSDFEIGALGDIGWTNAVALPGEGEGEGEGEVEGEIIPGEVEGEGEINQAPVLDPIGNRTLTEGELLEFTVTATDPDGNNLTFSASVPPGATFNSSTQTFSWTPGFDQAGSYSVSFTVTDDGFPSMFDVEFITILVLEGNRPPVLDPIGNQMVTEGELLEFRVTGSDPDGDNLTFSASNLPSGASFDPETQVFNWQTQIGDAGTYNNVEFWVDDNGDPPLFDIERITITVWVDVNEHPVLNPIGNHILDEGQLLEFTVTATDPDGGELTFSVISLPEGASFDPETHAFSWQTEIGDAGVYTDILCMVTDDGDPPMIDSEYITIIVIEAQPGGEGEGEVIVGEGEGEGEVPGEGEGEGEPEGEGEAIGAEGEGGPTPADCPTSALAAENPLGGHLGLIRGIRDRHLMRSRSGVDLTRYFYSEGSASAMFFSP